MNEITLITPPDKLFNKTRSILLLYPSTDTKKECQQILQKSDSQLNLYLYDINTEDHYYDWLLDIHRTVDLCFIDIDNLPLEIKSIESFLISFPNTYYKTNGENILYNKISLNRLYSLNDIANKIGGLFEVS